MGGVELAAKCFKGNRIYKGKFHFGGKFHDFKEIFLGDVAFKWLQLYDKKSPIIPLYQYLTMYVIF